MPFRLLKFLLLLVLMPAVALAAQREDYLRWHEACLAADDAKTIDGYIARYEEALAERPDDLLAKVYLGSAHTLRSAESGWGRAKLEHLKKGGRMMDEAVAAAPDDSRIRFVRAVNCYRVPKRFDRRPIAVEDFRRLIPVAVKGEGDLSTRERQAILYYGWQTMKEDGDKGLAEQARQHCHRLAPQSKYGKASGG